MYFGIPNSQKDEPLTSLESLYLGRRTRRGGDSYVRFGRSVDSMLPDAESYIYSFGQADKKSGNYMRFGRSIPDVEPEVDADKDKRYMRFGRANIAYHTDNKRYMRFGRGDDKILGNDIEGFKGYMRFGKRGDSNNEILESPAKRQYVRFGRAGGYTNDIAEDKRYMRFGRTNSDAEIDVDAKELMNYDSSLEGNEANKRYMRFGKKNIGMQEEKRYMRFGRAENKLLGDEIGSFKGYVRFGKRGGDDNEIFESPIKNTYTQFGRAGGSSNDINDDKRYMRFGRKKSADETGVGAKEFMKRYMRFGKKSRGTQKRFRNEEQGNDVDGDSIYMRSSKHVPDDTNVEQDKGYMSYVHKDNGEIAEAKRYMRFGKKDEADSGAHSMHADEPDMRLSKRSTPDIEHSDEQKRSTTR